MVILVHEGPAGVLKDVSGVFKEVFMVFSETIVFSVSRSLNKL